MRGGCPLMKRRRAVPWLLASAVLLAVPAQAEPAASGAATPLVLEESARLDRERQEASDLVGTESVAAGPLSTKAPSQASHHAAIPGADGEPDEAPGVSVAPRDLPSGGSSV